MSISCFLAYSRENINTTKDVTEIITNSLRLRINMHKIYPHFMYKIRFVRVWVIRNDIVHPGMVCRHLGYPIVVEISHVKLIEWVSKKVEECLRIGGLKFVLFMYTT